MTVEQMIQVLQKLPLKQEVMTKNGSDAYPSYMKVFKENGKLIPYIGASFDGEHRNYPQNYKGSEEIDIDKL